MHLKAFTNHFEGSEDGDRCGMLLYTILNTTAIDVAVQRHRCNDFRREDSDRHDAIQLNVIQLNPGCERK